MSFKKLDDIITLLEQQQLLAKPKARYRLSTKQKTKLSDLSLIKIGQHGVHLHLFMANYLINNLDLLACHTEKSEEDKLLGIMRACEQVAPTGAMYYGYDNFYERQRSFRDALYFGQDDEIEKMLNVPKDPQCIDYKANEPFAEILFSPFLLNYFHKLSDKVAYQAFATMFRTHQRHKKDVLYLTQLLEQVCGKQSAANLVETNSVEDNFIGSNKPLCEYLLAEQYLYQLRIDEFKCLLDTSDDSFYALVLFASYAFITGDINAALTLFEKAIKAKNKLVRRKNPFMTGIGGYFYKLALIIKGNQEDASYSFAALQQIDFEQRSQALQDDSIVLSLALRKPINCLQDGESYTHRAFSSLSDDIKDHFYHHLCLLNHMLGSIWCNQSQQGDFAKQAIESQQVFDDMGYILFAKMFEQCATYFSRQSIDDKQTLINLPTQIKSKAQWDIALDKLIALKGRSDDKKTPDKPQKTSRIIWELCLDGEPSLRAREQKLNKSGWSKGRVISLKRLKTETEFFTSLTSSDLNICSAIKAYQGYGYYASTEYELAGLPALRAAVGIDNLYLEDDFYDPVEIIKQTPELHVTEIGAELCLSIPHATVEDTFNEYSKDVYSFSELSYRRYQLIEFLPEHQKVIDILGDDGLLIPISAKQKALDGISAIAPLLNIRSNIEALDTGLKTIESDPHLIINIAPLKQGLSFTCVVMPFGETGPAFTPGIGDASLSAEIDGQRLATQRDLVIEETLLDKLDKACPAFLAMPGNSLSLDEPEQALEALEQLELASSNEDFDLLLRWPKGKKISLSKPLESQHLQLALNKKPEWFDIGGDLSIDNEQVIDLRRLLALVGTSNGRYIELDSQHILVLSKDLRERLELMNQVIEDGRFHPLASLQVEKATTGMRMKTIDAWDKQTLKMRESIDITPKIPSTFQGELRDYQQVGFDWAMRLAHWGAGACLADDMGLGKTLQALSVLLARAPNGPALVIAPTSVCHNWQQEALTFAPTLNIRLFADAVTSDQRSELLASLQAFDCVIISYGLLQRMSEKLQEVKWHTIVADEAQALKNPLTKRSKAAFALKGDFKMITTGTPIENDLTELWSLFRFINPGLLGNLKAFGKRFALPIANAREDKLKAHAANKALKAMIQPFILRRMKTQVLTELPPRTNINIQVNMSEKEEAFYEALRLNAIENISQGVAQGNQSNAGEQRIRMLAELVKLRQACCHSKLVLAESTIPSAKLAALEELLVELRLNNHKALIFSQFVGHLQLIKQHIESLGFSYQYLDGSTPQKERQKRVNAFQAGDGDLFLISLKAGGSGLNLTAADYVIHMDPWWNPAVEEQASDRAHRIGQTRPVTIYRLITANTIEEKIVSLHQHKRDIAENLLTGTEVTEKLSVEDMLNLLKKTF